MKHFIVGSITIFAILASGCCSIIHGTSQEIPVNSVPSGAKVFHNGILAGTTPALLDLKRKRHHVIRLEKEGYAPVEKTLSKSTSGWVAGNIIFGGLIGLAVDAINGAFYNITPDNVDMMLLPEQQLVASAPTSSTEPDEPGAQQDTTEEVSSSALVRNTGASAAERLKLISELHNAGILTDDEYEAKRIVLIQDL